jgi:hypothetical protein
MKPQIFETLVARQAGGGRNAYTTITRYFSPTPLRSVQFLESWRGVLESRRNELIGWRRRPPKRPSRSSRLGG